MSEWRERWADLRLMIWLMGASVVSGEVIAWTMRESGFF
jgi:hypothetical protein